MAENRIVAVGLLTQHDLEVLGSAFTRVWPLDDAPCFEGLIEAIDEADREHWWSRDASAEITAKITLP